MGKGRLERIAALTALGTASVMVAGVVSVPAALTLPSTDPVTTTVDGATQTVDSATQSITPTTTTPTVTTAPEPTKTITDTATSTLDTTGSTAKQTTDTVNKTTGTVTQSPTSSGSGGSGGGGTGSTLTKQASSTIGAVTDPASGGTSGAQSGTSGALSTAGGGSAGSGSSLAALGFFDGTGGPGGSAGGGGTSIFGPAAGAGGGGGGLPPTLTAAGARQLRFALEQLDGCMSAIAPIDRRVLGMRAGGGGTPPLSRKQVASRLGVSTRQVRLSERRGLSGLRVAAEQTGCAGAHGGPFAVSGIGDLALVAFASAPGASIATPGGGAAGDYVPARVAQATPGSPLMDLQGNGAGGPAWLVVLVTILFCVSIAALTRELRSSVGA
jgi:hypothetical protein